jgi:PPM family protein phosphatase
VSPDGLRISAYGTSDVGLVREGNEDSLFVGRTVFAVADGMGGHQAGEVASQKALEPVASLDSTDYPSPEDATGALVEAITAANTAVVAEGAADPSKSGMGTTLTVVMVRSGKIHLAHVGDSRAYLLRDGESISQLTTDHTLVEQLIREGRISREQAATHPQRSVITRAIGVDQEVDVDSFPPLELEPGDQILLCSDGLTGPVSDEQITTILRETDDGDAACAALVDAAKQGGAPDNITVVLLRVDGERAGGPPPLEPEEANATAPIASPLDNEPAAPPASDEAAAAAVGPGTAPTPEVAKPRSSEGATPIRTRPEPGVDTNWAERMGRYGKTQGTEPAPTRNRRRGRVAAAILGVIVILAILVGGGYALLSRSFFVGDAEGQIAIFNGVPQSVVGLDLFWLREETDLATDDLPPFRADQVREGVTASSLTQARETVERYREIIAGAQRDTPGDATPDDADTGTGTGTDEPTPAPDPTPAPTP